MENYAFTRKSIDKAQRLSMKTDGAFLGAINEYLTNLGRLAWDDARALWWVSYPVSKDKQEWQVAVWLMDVAAQFEPREAA